jgi:hypothetical protein
LKIMTRLTVALSAPASLWDGLSASIRALASQVSPAPTEVSGLEVIERVRASVQRSSRHWLM